MTVGGRRMRASIRAFAAVSALLAVTVAATGAPPAVGSADAARPAGPTSLRATGFAVSPPVRDLPPASSAAGEAAPPRVNPLAGGAAGPGPAARIGGSAPRDPLAGAPAPASRTPRTDLLFQGSSNPSACGGCTPPDPNGDIGANNYIQIVNATKVAIYDKTGTQLVPTFDLGDLWSSGPCHNEDGDPVVLYDTLADRWLLAQLNFSKGPDALCFAVSQTGDPTGSYFLYQFNTPDLPDYFKVGVWPTGYYVSTNEASYSAYALDRTKMLAGDSTATAIRFQGKKNFLMPATVVGVDPPDPQGGLYYTFKDDVFHGGVDRIELYQLTPDFATPANSTFDKIESLPIAPFTYTVCGFFHLNCIPQGGTKQKVDAVSEWPMFRFDYRRFADREALVGNFTVGGGDGGAGAAIRWFELRDTGSGWDLFQEGTQDTPGVDQFMGSVNIDAAGDIALGYSESSPSTPLSISYATRRPGEPAGTLEPERVLSAGGGSQTGSNRWGDYSAMGIDPNNGCDFWYTNEYYKGDSAVKWRTAIGSFAVRQCAAASRSLTVTTAGAGSGTVTGPGIHCPGDCTQSFAAGQRATLTASAAPGSSATLSGACAHRGTCTVTMGGNEGVTATFRRTAGTGPP